MDGFKCVIVDPAFLILDALHKRIEKEDEVVQFFSADLRTEFGENAANVRYGFPVCSLEGREQFQAAVGFHIVIIHGQQLQQLLSLFQ